MCPIDRRWLLLLLLLMLPISLLASSVSGLDATREALTLVDSKQVRQDAPGSASLSQLELSSQGGQQAFKQYQQQQPQQPQQQQQPQYLDPQRLVEFGLNPMGSAVKYFLPNTYQGLTSDLGNGYVLLSSGLNKGFKGLQSQFGSFSDILADQLQQAELSLLGRLWEVGRQQEELVRKLAELVNNPEQICRQLSEKGQSAYESSSSQAKRQPSSWFGR